MSKFIKTKIKHFINENNSYKNVIFKTEGEYDIEYADLIYKLNIINDFFPYKNVSGVYDSTDGVNLKFDNGIIIKGSFDSEPFIVQFMIDNEVYDLDIHPHGSLGEFDNTKFKDNIELIKKEINTITIAVVNGEYAVKTISIDKSELNDYKIYLIKGNITEGKLIKDNSMIINKIKL